MKEVGQVLGRDLERERGRDSPRGRHMTEVKMAASVFAGRSRTGSSRLPVQIDADGNEAEARGIFLSKERSLEFRTNPI